IDSRTTQPGDLFFAIKGDRFDGHDYVSKAFRAGAVLAVVSEDKLPALGRANGPMLVVKNVLEALGTLGIAARERTNARIFAVTGSVGKTSTKEMLAIGLRNCGRVHASVKSFNNHWGVPLTLARMPANAEYGIFEIGMNHPGEIEPLVKMVRPHCAIVTTIAPVHLEAFDNVAGIATAKAEIFMGLEPGGTVILNRDNEFFDYLKEQAEKAWAGTVLSFGNKKGADCQLAKFTLVENGCQIQAKVQGENITFSMPTSGRYLAENAMAVLLAAKDQGADLQKVSAALAGYKLLDGRGASIQLSLQSGSYTLLDESYNANPASMKASIGLLSTIPTEGRRLLVLGDMLELGDEGPAHHSALIDAIEQANIDRVFLCGTMMSHLWEKLAASQKAHYSLSSSELMAPLLNEIQSKDVVMVKGSLGMSMSGIVNTLKTIHFQPAADDVAVTKDS
ncbi:MAG: UDP-N-acetylmuramoylalanyl-D-glutamyl-2,6-diaminopimelate--D-alanyl-D-alanine ligase, partial [Rhizobiales bacterium]|nr:UDP-N-acetylmuramoylalanyl-D-glutamyl-2,6-diaminopimelate--D-alanyl-D-alanine ligase [Hyphomicrobiales bacterium]